MEKITKAKKNKAVSKFTSTKNLSARPKWMESRFKELISRVEKKKKVSKSKVLLELEKAEFESIIDCIQRAIKGAYLKGRFMDLRKEADMVEDEVLEFLVKFQQAQKAIPEKGVEPKHYREACLCFGLSLPGRGRNKFYDENEVENFHKDATKIATERNGNKPLSTDQKKRIILLVKEKFNMPTYDSTYQYLLKLGIKNLPWQNKGEVIPK